MLLHGSAVHLPVTRRRSTCRDACFASPSTSASSQPLPDDRQCRRDPAFPQDHALRCRDRQVLTSFTGRHGPSPELGSELLG